VVVEVALPRPSLKNCGRATERANTLEPFGLQRNRGRRPQRTITCSLSIAGATVPARGGKRKGDPIEDRSVSAGADKKQGKLSSARRVCGPDSHAEIQESSSAPGRRSGVQALCCWQRRRGGCRLAGVGEYSMAAVYILLYYLFGYTPGCGL
jgi:hypothetical protein